MAFKIQKNVPMPDGVRSGVAGQMGDEALAIMSLEEEGDSFFVPTPNVDERPRIQKRLVTKSCQMRNHGHIEFFIVTRRTREFDEDLGREVDGVRVWRRATNIEPMDGDEEAGGGN